MITVKRATVLFLLVVPGGLIPVISACGSTSKHASDTTVIGGSGSGPTTARQPKVRHSLVGIWTASDGSGKKVMRQNGSCSGFSYIQGQMLDIGGPMMCQMSTKADAAGRYALDVTQSPNELGYLVKFDGPDDATVYEEDGKELYRMTRS